MDSRDWFEVFVIVLFFVALVVGAFAGLAYGVAQPSCYASTERIGMESTWSFWSGCLVKTPEGDWIPLDNWFYEANK